MKLADLLASTESFNSEVDKVDHTLYELENYFKGYIDPKSGFFLGYSEFSPQHQVVYSILIPLREDYFFSKFEESIKDTKNMSFIPFESYVKTRSGILFSEGFASLLKFNYPKHKFDEEYCPVILIGNEVSIL